MNYVDAGAVSTQDGKYRYQLWRVWDKSKPRAAIIMLNPSTADAATDDPTIKSCVRLLDALEFGGFNVVNLFAYRATDPKELPRSDRARGALNPRHIEHVCKQSKTVICAWGANVRAREVSKGVLGLIELNHDRAYCFGKNQVGGSPKHPLYIKTGTPLKIFRKFKS